MSLDKRNFLNMRAYSDSLTLWDGNTDKTNYTCKDRLLEGVCTMWKQKRFSLGFWKESATDQFSTLFQVSNPTFYFSILNWSFPRWYLWHKLVFPISTEIISLFRIKILWRRRGKNRWKNLVKIILVTNLYKVHIVPKVLLYSIIDSATLFWFTILHWYGRLTALSSGSFLGLGPPWNSL